MSVCVCVWVGVMVHIHICFLLKSQGLRVCVCVRVRALTHFRCFVRLCARTSGLVFKSVMWCLHLFWCVCSRETNHRTSVCVCVCVYVCVVMQRDHLCTG